MKKIGIALLGVLSLGALSATAANTSAEIQSARFNEDTQTIEIDVRYPFGVKAKNFDLEVVECAESSPVYCDVNLVEFGLQKDVAKGAPGSILIPLKETKLSQPYYRGARLSIYGARNSHALVMLPRESEEPKATTAEVVAARYNASTESIEVDLRFPKGTKAKKFGLKRKGCMESYPVSCNATLVEYGSLESCDTTALETVVITLKEAKLDGSYYDGAGISIVGSNETRGYVELPRR